MTADWIERVRTWRTQAPDADRADRLQEVADWVTAQHAAGSPAGLQFVCTHNSRRSQLAQVWATAAAEVFGLAAVQATSAGTERSAVHPAVGRALQEAGFDVREGTAPGELRVEIGRRTLVLRSKTLEDQPAEGMAAVMVCADADAACPFVPGAARRVSLPFDDPRHADGTAEEAAAYGRASDRIGRELAWALGQAA